MERGTRHDCSPHEGVKMANTGKLDNNTGIVYTGVWR